MKPTFANNAFMASVSVAGAPGPLYSFVAAPGGCVAIAFGSPGPMSCFFTALMVGSKFTATVAANFSMASHNSSGAGCIFNCGGGSRHCIVQGATGLPVELMGFSIDSLEASEEGSRASHGEE